MSDPRLIAVIRFVAAFTLGSPNFAAASNGSRYFSSQTAIALAEAAGSGDIAEIQRLLDKGIDVNLKRNGGMTFLIFALSRSQNETFGFLLEKGANPIMQREENGFSAMLLAAIYSDSSYLRIVLKYHGDPNLVNPKREQTPIYESIARLRPEI